MSARQCGGCTLCCTALAVPELNKPNGVPCVHLTPEGCGIYDERPPSCRVFECVWLQGMGPEDQRPDVTGAVFVPEDDFSGDRLGEALVIYSDPEGKDPVESPYVRAVIESVLKASETAILVRGDEPRRLLTTEGSRYSQRIRELQAEGRLPK